MNDRARTIIWALAFAASIAGVITLYILNMIALWLAVTLIIVEISVFVILYQYTIARTLRVLLKVRHQKRKDAIELRRMKKCLDQAKRIREPVIMRSPMRQERFLKAKAVVRAPQPIKPMIDSEVHIYIIPATSTDETKKDAEHTYETVALALANTLMIKIKAVSNSFVVSPKERSVPVPHPPLYKSETHFLIRTKDRIVRGTHKIFFEFYQNEELLNSANFDLTVDNQEQKEVQFTVPISIKIHL